MGRWAGTPPQSRMPTEQEAASLSLATGSDEQLALLLAGAPDSDADRASHGHEGDKEELEVQRIGQAGQAGSDATHASDDFAPLAASTEFTPPIKVPSARGSATEGSDPAMATPASIGKVERRLFLGRGSGTGVSAQASDASIVQWEQQSIRALDTRLSCALPRSVETGHVAEPGLVAVSSNTHARDCEK